MVFRFEVEQIATKLLRHRLKNNKNVLKFLMAPPKWNTWLDLMRDRMNQVDLYLSKEGISLERAQVERFIQHGAIAYSKAQIDAQVGEDL